MNTIDVADFERDPSGWLRRVEQGETLWVVDRARVIAEVRPGPATPGATRPWGLCAGEFQVPADFDAPLPQEILSDFEGS